jgi:hypothetical protein
MISLFTFHFSLSKALPLPGCFWWGIMFLVLKNHREMQGQGGHGRVADKMMVREFLFGLGIVELAA